MRVSGGERELPSGAWRRATLCTPPVRALRACGCPVCVAGLTVVFRLISSRTHLSDGCTSRRRRCACRRLSRLFAVGERLRESTATDVRVVNMQLDVASVYKVVNYLTRLETRIAEFSVAASQ